VAGDYLVRRGEAEHDRFGGVDVADHHSVPDRLDHLAAPGLRDLGDLAAEGGGEVGGVSVPVRLGQRGVAGYVGKDEGPALSLSRGHVTTVLVDV
jgi:hypothetical protein